MKTWRKLKQKAPETLTEQIGDQSEVAHQRLAPNEPLSVRDQLVGFNRIDELAPADLALPGLDGVECGPAVEGRVEFDGVELTRVIVEPLGTGRTFGIEAGAPVPVIPPAATDEIFLAGRKS